MRKKAGKKQEERFILCLDGGGMRGVVSTTVLAKLGDLLRQKGDYAPLACHFDLIAGTSTGGIIALAMTIPSERCGMHISVDDPAPAYKVLPRGFWDRLMKKPAVKVPIGTFPQTANTKTIRSLYYAIGPRIFPTRQFGILNQLFSEKYDDAGFNSVLKEMFGDTPLSEAVVPTMVMTYDITGRGRPYPIASFDDHRFLFREAARATSAAPTYFSPLAVKDRKSGENVLLVDGGVVANNPTLYALREARHLYPDCSLFHVLSLATREPDIGFSYAQAFFGWLDPTQGFPLQKTYSTAAEQTENVIAASEKDVDYTRIEGPLTTRYKMDDAREETLRQLEKDGERFAADNMRELERYASLLCARTDFSQARIITNALQTGTA